MKPTVEKVGAYIIFDILKSLLTVFSILNIFALYKNTLKIAQCLMHKSY